MKIFSDKKHLKNQHFYDKILRTCKVRSRKMWELYIRGNGNVQNFEEKGAQPHRHDDGNRSAL
ncbi:MAG: hypothetical protein II373_02380, partial [Clostridia bacterium]|nr:hypothetical protein [Clostridia bacterium]